MWIFDVDASLEGVPRQVLARPYITKLQASIEKYRKDRITESLVKNALFALLATVIFIVSLKFLLWMLRKLNVMIESRYKEKIHALHIQSLEFIHAERIWTTLTGAVNVIRLVLTFVLLYFYLHVVLSLFPWTRLLAANLLDYALFPLRTMGKGLLKYMPNLIFIVVFVVAKLTDEDLLTYESFRYGREIAIEGFRYPSELLPVSQFGGLHTYFAELGSGGGAHPFKTAQDYDNFLARMDGFGAWVDQSIANMRSGAERGLVQPRIIVERMIPQLAVLAVSDPKQSVFWQPITGFPAAVKAADRERLTKAYADKLATKVLPAYQRLHDFLKDEYLDEARPTIAWSELGNGTEWYSYLVRYHTTTSMTPDEIHELGLKEVARIRDEMEHVKKQLGHDGDLRSFFDALRADSNLYFTDPAELVAGYQAIRERVDAGMPLLFARNPRAGFEIRPVEAFRAASEATGSYMPGSPDGQRPGVFYVNTHDLPSRPKYAMEALYLHEAVPGHHYQISLAQEATDLPRFRRFAWDTAYGEGWALYAETLGPDLGLYTDPYSAFGALASEMWRCTSSATACSSWPP